MSKRIIGLIGFIGSGKDTAADYLVEKHNFTRLSFAGTLKDAVAAVFGWDRELLEGKTAEARDWRESVDSWWADRLRMPQLTPRWVLQQWGTEVCRRNFHDDIWIASIEHKLAAIDKDVVISDCRFPNEITAIRKQGGKVGRIIRGPNPDWFELAVAANNHSHPYYSQSKKMFDVLEIHPSESAWIGSRLDFEIDNNSTLENLYVLVEAAL